MQHTKMVELLRKNDQPKSPTLMSTPTKRIRVDENITNEGSCDNHRGDDDTTLMSLVEEEDANEGSPAKVQRMTTDTDTDTGHKHGHDNREGNTDDERIGKEAAGKEGGKEEQMDDEAPDSKNDDDRVDPRKKAADAKANDGCDKTDCSESSSAASSKTGTIADSSMETNSPKMAATSENKESEMPPLKGSASTSSSKPTKTKKLNYIPSKLGRKGDPRMHRALKARIDNPKLSLLDALKQGGFEFHWNGGTSYDSDNVQLGQRKNQLSRRLRLYKQNQNQNKVEELEKRVNLCSGGGGGDSAKSSQQNQQGSPNHDSRKRKVPDNNDINDNDTYHLNHPPTSFHHFNRNNMTNSKNNYAEIMQMMMSKVAGTQPQCTFQPNNVDQSSFHYQNRHDFYNATKEAHGSANQQQLNPSMPPLSNATMNNIAGVGAVESGNGSTAVPSVTLSSTDLFDFQQKINAVLMNHSNISNTVVPQPSSDKVQKLYDALNQYRFDSSALMKRCMLSAGFTHQETEECDEMYLLFGELAVQDEMKRIGRIRSRMNGGNHHHNHHQHRHQQQPVMTPPPSATTTMGSGESFTMESMLEYMKRATSDTSTTTTTNIASNNVNAVLAKHLSGSNGNSNDRNSCSSSSNNCSSAGGNNIDASKSDVGAQRSSHHHHHHHHHQHQHQQHQPFSDSKNNHDCDHMHTKSISQDHSSALSHSDHINNTQEGAANKETGGPCVNQHVHRLEGRCGHRAIIHKPADGNPHIDFVVDGKIECYKDCQPMMSDSNSTAFWFSKLKCDKNHCSHDNDLWVRLLFQFIDFSIFFENSIISF